MTVGYLRRTNCPICAAPVSRSKAAVSSTPAAETIPFGSHGEFLSGYTSKRVFFTYNRCGQCAGLYCPTYFSQEQLDQLYSRQAENMADVPLPAREATQRAYFEIFSGHPLPAGSYVELGADIGLFATRCAKERRFSRFYLYEPNLEVHTLLRQKLAGCDAVVSSASYYRGALPADTVAAAVAIHVLDHLIEPAQLLRGLFEDLTTGGILFLVTHNEASLLSRVLGYRWPPFTLQHPQLFSPRSIVFLLERCGFSVREVIRTRNYFPVTHLLRAAFEVAGLERFAPPMSSRFTLGLKLGNIATVASKPG